MAQPTSRPMPSSQCPETGPNAHVTVSYYTNEQWQAAFTWTVSVHSSRSPIGFKLNYQHRLSHDNDDDGDSNGGNDDDDDDDDDAMEAESEV